jgi:hypothetical protein
MKIYETLPLEERHQCIMDARASLGTRHWLSFVRSVHELDMDNEMWESRPPNWEPQNPLRGQVPRLRDTWTQDEGALLEAQATPPPGMVSSGTDPLKRTHNDVVFKKKENKGYGREDFRDDIENWTENMKWLLGKRNELRGLMPDLVDDYSESETGTEVATDTETEAREGRARAAGLKHIYGPRPRPRRRRHHRYY